MSSHSSETEWTMAAERLASARLRTEHAVAALEASTLPPALQPHHGVLIEIFQSHLRSAIQTAEDPAFSGVDRRGRRRSLGLAAFEACEVAAKEFLTPSIRDLSAAEALAAVIANIDSCPRGSPYRFRDPLFERGEWLDKVSYDLSKLMWKIDPNSRAPQKAITSSRLAKLEKILAEMEGLAWAKLARLDRISEKSIPDLASAELGLARSMRYLAASELHHIRSISQDRIDKLVFCMFVFVSYIKRQDDHIVGLAETVWKYISSWNFSEITSISENHEILLNDTDSMANSINGSVDSAINYLGAKYRELCSPLSQAVRAIDIESSYSSIPSGIIGIALRNPAIAKDVYAVLLALRDGITLDDTDDLLSMIANGRPGTRYIDFFQVRVESGSENKEYLYYAINVSDQNECVVRLPKYNRVDVGVECMKKARNIYVAVTFDGGFPDSLRIHSSVISITEMNEGLSNAAVSISRGTVRSGGDIEAPALDFLRSVVGNDCLSKHYTVRNAGSLSVFPLEAVSIDGKCIGDEASILYLNESPIIYIGRAEEKLDRFTLLAVADCDYDASLVRRGHSLTIRGIKRLFEPLPASGLEAADLGLLFDATILKADHASRMNVEEAIWDGPTIAHFATHGFYVEPETDVSSVFEPLIPLSFLRKGEVLGGILLSGANEGINDAGDVVINSEACLEFSEIVGLDFSRTRLVTLSACQSGAGAVTPWSGSLGIREAFLAAGAGTIVASLWEVADSDTADFMHHFYCGLHSGIPVSSALLYARQRSQAASAVKFAFVALGRDPRFCGETSGNQSGDER